MVTIKSYTDISQSKKLAEILPIESADMYYNLAESKIPNFIVGSHSDYRCYIPCWSLAALLGVLPKLHKLQHSEEGYYCSLANYKYITEAYNNPVDACVAMIEKLCEIKML